MPTFKQLGLRPELVQALDGLGFTTPTPIQEQSIPQVLTGEGDLIALAQTGTGKTAAFSLPVLHQLDTDSNNVQCIVLCPTRELCLQISKDMEAFSAHMPVRTVAVYGGASMETQIRALKRGSQVVIGTPGRTVDLINRGVLKLGDVRFLILDEADEMLNMGFKDDLDLILAETPKEKRTLLFSATMPPEIRSISKKYMNDPVEVKVKSDSTGAATVEHIFYLVNARDKYDVLKRVADLNPDVYGIVFCRTRRETQEIANKLMSDGYNADALHGDLSQAQRDTIMGRFRTKHLQLLVATDVAARGLDVNNLTHVINYSLPDEAEAYIHRSGRTGRAGKTGVSIAIVHSRETNKLRLIEKKVGRKFEQRPVPSGREICEVQLFHIVDRISKLEVDEEQIAKYLPAVLKQLDGLDRETIIKKLVTHEFSTFLNYYKNAIDLNVSERKTKRERIDGEQPFNHLGSAKGTATSMAKFKINVGRRDNVNPSTLIGFLNDNLNRRDVEVGRIDVMNTTSFFEIDAAYADKLREALNGADRGGRTIILEDARPSEFGNREDSRPPFKKRFDERGDKGFKKPWEKTDRPVRSGDDRPKRAPFGQDRESRPPFGKNREERGGSGTAGGNRDKFQKRFEARPPAGGKAKPFSTKFKGKPRRKD